LGPFTLTHCREAGTKQALGAQVHIKKNTAKEEVKNILHVVSSFSCIGNARFEVLTVVGHHKGQADHEKFFLNCLSLENA
jgi:hypothetical protein